MEISPEEWNEVRKNVQLTKDAVVGNERIGLTGLVKRTDVLEAKLRKLDIRLASIIGGAAAVLWIIDRFFMP